MQTTIIRIVLYPQKQPVYRSMAFGTFCTGRSMFKLYKKLLKGSSILIDDDADDQHLITGMLEDLNLDGHLRLLNDGAQGLEYLLTTTEKPF